jgi:hypothetical protein
LVVKVEDAQCESCASMTFMMEDGMEATLKVTTLKGIAKYNAKVKSLAASYASQAAFAAKMAVSLSDAAARAKAYAIAETFEKRAATTMALAVA